MPKLNYSSAVAEPFTVTIDDEEFACHPAIPYDALRKHILSAMNGGFLISEVADDPASDPFWSFWLDALQDGEYDRFRKFIDDPTRVVDAHLLVRITADVIREYSGLPLGLRSASSPGEIPKADSSSEVSPSGA